MTDTKAPRTISVETARELLLHLMQWDSEESYAAGWISGNEYRLWSQATRDSVVAGKVGDDQPYRWMQELAVVADGWWVWPYDAMSSPGPSFVGMREWLPIYAAHRQRLIEQYGPEGWAARLPLAEKENRARLKAFLDKAEAFGKRPGQHAVRRETAAAQLLRLMEEESEDNWATSWERDHEYMLWASVVGDDPGEIRGGSSEPARLKELAALADGWFAWAKELDDVEFLPMGRWLVMYRQYREAQSGEDGGSKA